MAPVPEIQYVSSEGQQWMAMVLGGVLTACVSLTIALIVVLCGGGKPKDDGPKDENPPPTPSGDEAPPAEAPKEPSTKEVPKEPSAKETPKEPSSKPAPSATTGASGKAPELKLTSEKPAQSAIGKSAKGTVDLKKMPSLQLATTKK